MRPYSVSWPRTLVGSAAFLVDLVDRDHDRDTGRLGVVERLDGLRHHTVVRRHHEDRDVGGLGTTGTHGGERLVTRGVDEGDATLGAVDLGRDLVGTDVLGDATGLLVDDVGVAQRVEELGLSVVDVTHDGDDRRADDQVVLVALVLTELEVERLEQLAVLVLRGHDLHDVVELLAEQLERLVVDRLGRGHHLAEREQHLHECGRVDTDALGEVRQRRTARQTDGLAVALADTHATDGRGLHGLELLTTGALALATTTRRATRATEGTLGLATLAGTTATGTTATAGTTGEAAGPTGTATGSTGTLATTARGTATGRTATAAAGTAGATAAGTAGTTAGALAERGRGLRHHRRVGTRHAGATGSATVTAGRRTRGTLLVAATGTAGGARGTAGTARGTRRTAVRGCGPTAHALVGRERVVARTRGAGTTHGTRGRALGRRGGRAARLGSLGLGRSGLGSSRLGAGLRARPCRSRGRGGRCGRRLVGCRSSRGLGCRSSRGLDGGLLSGRAGVRRLHRGLGGRGGRLGLGAGPGTGPGRGLLLGSGSCGVGRCLQLLAVLLLELHRDRGFHGG